MAKARKKGLAALLASLFALVLAAFLCMGMPARDAHAQDETQYNVGTAEDGLINLPQELVNAINAAGKDGVSPTVTLGGNILLDLTEENAITGIGPNGHLFLMSGYHSDELTIDLNGYSLKIVTGSSMCCLELRDGASLKIIDSSEAGTGAVVGESEGTFVTASANSTLALENVTVDYTYTGTAQQLPSAITSQGSVSLDGVDFVLENAASGVSTTTGADITYATLQDEINAAANGATVTLKDSVTESIVIPAGKTITLDLGGHTITNTENEHTITNYGTLTVTGTGTVDNISHQRVAIFNAEGGTAYLNSGTYTRSAEASEDFDSSGGNSFYVILNQGMMTIGTADSTPVIRFPEGKGDFSSLVDNGWYTASQNTNGVTATLTVLNGTFCGRQTQP